MLPNMNTGGFYTEEIRDQGQRVGFFVQTLDGEQEVLAHMNFSHGTRVGKYGVDVRTFENLVIPCLKKATEKSDLIIIDEIGKMELFSDLFRAAVMACLYADVSVIATIMSQSHPFVDKIKMRDDVKRMEVTKDEQGFLVKEIIERLDFQENK